MAKYANIKFSLKFKALDIDMRWHLQAQQIILKISENHCLRDKVWSMVGNVSTLAELS